jgi:hypothetical protein
MYFYLHVILVCAEFRSKYFLIISLIGKTTSIKINVHRDMGNKILTSMYFNTKYEFTTL